MTPAQQAKAQILERVRELTNRGRHVEASRLFIEHFQGEGSEVAAKQEMG